jgi:hypothetical protein
MPTCGEIGKAVREYNAGNPTEDGALELALGSIQSLPRSFGRLLAEVCLIADWGSLNLPYFPFDARVAMAREIEACGFVLEAIRRWQLENLDAAETKVLTDALEQQISRTSLLKPPDTDSRQLSLLSKYLHWRVNGAFPIWDANARAALDCHGGDDDPSWRSYISWVIRVRQEATRHKSCCLEKLRIDGECLLRTFDKALYIIGDTYQLVVDGNNVPDPMRWTEVEKAGQKLISATELPVSAFLVAHPRKKYPIRKSQTKRVESLRAEGEKLAMQLGLQRSRRG